MVISSHKTEVEVPEHFLALIKQSANLASTNEAQRSAAAFVSSLSATLDAKIFDQINSNLPEYLRIKPRQRFFLHRKQENKQFNQQIFLQRIVDTLNLTDEAEARNHVSGVMYALGVIQPNTKQKLSSSLPTDLNKFW